MVIEVLADQIEWLRWQLTRVPHVSPVLAAGGSPPSDDADRKMHLSEEEEDILALRLNDLISDQDIAALGLPNVQVKPDE